MAMFYLTILDEVHQFSIDTNVQWACNVLFFKFSAVGEKVTKRQCSPEYGSVLPIQRHQSVNLSPDEKNVAATEAYNDVPDDREA